MLQQEARGPKGESCVRGSCIRNLRSKECRLLCAAEGKQDHSWPGQEHLRGTWFVLDKNIMVGLVARKFQGDRV